MGEYYGARGVDHWDAQVWEKEVNNHDVSKLAVPSAPFNLKAFARHIYI